MSTKNTIFENLVTALKNIKQSGGYNHTVQTVERSTIPFDTLQQAKPAIAILEGDEVIQVEDRTNLRNNTSFFLEATVDKSSDLAQEITELGDDIRKAIYTPPSLGSYCLDIFLTGQESLHLEQSIDDATLVMAGNLIWYDAKATADSVGTDIYGSSDIFKTCQDAVVSHLNSLITTMASYDPKLSYAHENHATAALKMNSVTVEMVDAARGDTGSQSAKEIAHWLMQFGLRVHTNYLGRYLDSGLVLYLLNSVEAYLNEHYLLASGYRIKDFDINSIRSEWADSATVGGEATLTVYHPQLYTQG